MLLTLKSEFGLTTERNKRGTKHKEGQERSSTALHSGSRRRSLAGTSSSSLVTRRHLMVRSFGEHVAISVSLARYR